MPLDLAAVFQKERVIGSSALSCYGWPANGVVILFSSRRELGMTHEQYVDNLNMDSYRHGHIEMHIRTMVDKLIEAEPKGWC